MIMKLTIPPCEPDEYDNRYTIIWPWLGIPVAIMLNTLKVPTDIKGLYCMPAALVWSLFFTYYAGWKENSVEKIEEQKCGKTILFFVEVVGLLCGFFWTAYVSGVLIDSLTFIGVIT